MSLELNNAEWTALGAAVINQAIADWFIAMNKRIKANYDLKTIKRKPGEDQRVFHLRQKNYESTFYRATAEIYDCEQFFKSDWLRGIAPWFDETIDVIGIIRYKWMHGMRKLPGMGVAEAMEYDCGADENGYSQSLSWPKLEDQGNEDAGPSSYSSLAFDEWLRAVDAAEAIKKKNKIQRACV